MRFVRPPLRLLVMIPTVALFFLLWGLGLPFVALSESGWSRWRATILRRTCSSLLFLMGAKVELHGDAPAAPFVLVSNHLSYVDVLLLAANLDTVFVSKYEVRNWPVLGLLCHWMGTVFIRRELRRDISRVLDEMAEHLEHRCGIVFFPEGTSTNGDQVLRFRPSLLEIAVRLGKPVSYASVRYSSPDRSRPADDWICWWGDRPFLEHFVGLLGLPGFRAELFFGDNPIQSDDRKVLATELRQAVAGQLSLA